MFHGGFIRVHGRPDGIFLETFLIILSFEPRSIRYRGNCRVATLLLNFSIGLKKIGCALEENVIFRIVETKIFLIDESFSNSYEDHRALDFATIIVLKQFIFKRITWTINERINEMVVGDSSKEKTARAKWGDVIKFLPVLSPQRATQRVGKLHHHRCVCSHVSWK